MHIPARALQWSESSRYASPAELFRDGRVTPGDKRMLNATLDVFDAARHFHGGPIIITSGRRSQARQDELQTTNARAAKVSTHTLGVALDIAVPEGLEDYEMVNLLLRAAVELHLPRPRLGYLSYRQNGESAKFVHFDYAFLLNLPDDAPRAWLKSSALW